MHEYQDALISSAFGYEDKQEFLDKQDQAMTVTTWDGKDRALISTDYIHKMFEEICMLGPLAGVYGREVQQILMQNDALDKISMEDFAYPVKMGRASLKATALRSSHQNNYAADQYSESDRRSQATQRTRSPRATRYYSDVREEREPRHYGHLESRFNRDIRDRRY